MLTPAAVLTTRYRRAVALLAVITLLWRAWTVSRWTWQDDDWLFIERGASMPLFAYLMQDYNSHVMPGGMLVTKLMVEISPLNFGLVVGLVAVACAASVSIWGWAFEKLTGGRMAALLPLAVIALSPVMMRPMMWWACSVTALPLQISLAVMVIIAVRYVEQPTRRRLRLLGLTLVIGLFFWEKSLFNVIPTTAVLVAVAEGSLRERIRAAAPPVAMLTAISVPYLAFFLYWTRGASSSNSVETSFVGQNLASISSDYARGFGEVLLPALAGGPWGTLPVDGDLFSRQSGAVTLAVSLIVVAMIAWGALRKPSLLWLILLPLSYALVTLGLVLFSSRSDELWDVMLTDRYYVDSVVVAMLAVALVIRAMPLSRVGRSRARRVATGVGVVLAASLVAGNATAADRIGDRPARHWVANLRDGLGSAMATPATPGAPLVVWDAFAPDSVLQGAFWGDDARLSSMLRPYHPQVRFGVATSNLHYVTGAGRLERASVAPAVRARRGPVEGCGYALDAGREIRVKMSGSLYFWNWALQVNAFSAEGAELVVDLGDQEVPISLPPGLQDRKIQFQGAVARTVRIRSESPVGTACISELFAGSVGPIN